MWSSEWCPVACNTHGGKVTGLSGGMTEGHHPVASVQGRAKQRATTFLTCLQQVCTLQRCSVLPLSTHGGHSSGIRHAVAWRMLQAHSHLAAHSSLTGLVQQTSASQGSALLAATGVAHEAGDRPKPPLVTSGSASTFWVETPVGHTHNLAQLGHCGSRRLELVLYR